MGNGFFDMVEKPIFRHQRPLIRRSTISFLMPYYCSHQEFVNRIVMLSKLYSEYRHSFPILSWSYENDENALVASLKEKNVEARLIKGPYYDSYAEGDSDLVLQTNYNSSVGVSYSADVFAKEDYRVNILVSRTWFIFPVISGPESLKQLSPTMDTLPQDQLLLLQVLFPKSVGTGAISFEMSESVTRTISF